VRGIVGARNQVGAYLRGSVAVSESDKGIYIIFCAHQEDTLADLQMKRQWLTFLAHDKLHPAASAQLDNALEDLDESITRLRSR
jgi:hypothetical protein